MNTALAAIGSAAALLALAAPADAQETTVKGETAEGVAVKLTVGEFGNATAFRVGKAEIECKRGGTLTTRKTTFTEFDRSDPGAFTGTFEDTSGSGGFKFKATTKVTGTQGADVSGPWSGTLKSKTRVLKDGEKVDTCKVSTTWDAG